MILVAGTRRGPHELLSPLEPPLFAVDSDRRAGFARDAQTLASLSHPHIAQIHGLETRVR